MQISLWRFRSITFVNDTIIAVADAKDVAGIQEGTMIEIITIRSAIADYQVIHVEELVGDTVLITAVETSVMSSGDPGCAEAARIISYLEGCGNYVRDLVREWLNK